MAAETPPFGCPEPDLALKWDAPSAYAAYFTLPADYHIALDTHPATQIEFAPLAHPPQRTPHRTHGTGQSAEPQNRSWRKLIPNGMK